MTPEDRIIELGKLRRAHCQHSQAVNLYVKLATSAANIHPDGWDSPIVKRHIKQAVDAQIRVIELQSRIEEMKVSK